MSFNKLFVLVAMVMFSLELFIAGSNFADNSTANGVVALVLAAFWGGFLLIEWTDRGRKLTHYRKLNKRVDDIFNTIAKVIDEPKKPNHKEELTKLLHQTIDKVTGGNRPPKQADIKAIETEFAKASGDHFAKLTIMPGGIQVEIADKPFKANRAKKAVVVAPGRSARHDEAAKRGDAARAKLNKKAPAKKVSKK